MSRKTEQDYHNDGQRDGAKNEYHRPHSSGSSLLDVISEVGGGLSKQDVRDIEAYDKGQDNARKK